MTRQGTRERIAKVFQARPGEWISVVTLFALVPARYRQAVSECRQRGMFIRNERRASKGRVLSFYKYEPSK